MNHGTVVWHRSGQRDLDCHLLSSHPSGTRCTGLTSYRQIVGQTHTQYADTRALADGRTCWWISSQTVTVTGNNFLLCQGIYMQINVISVQLLIPTINHHRLAHQFLAIIRSYRQGCNIILNTVSLPSIDSWHHRTLALLLSLPATLLPLLFGVRSGGDKWIKCPCVQHLPERLPTYPIRDLKKKKKGNFSISVLNSCVQMQKLATRCS